MNKREIMKKAVALAKTFLGDWAARMALALKTVWAEARKMVKKALPELKGTTKQVAWANDIREKAVAVLNGMVKEYATKLENGEVFSNKDDAYRAEKKAHLNEALDALVAVEDAKTWIELFGTNYAVTRKGVNRQALASAFAYEWLKAQMNRGRLADSFAKRMASYN
jgi:copper chaperone CopZ